MLSNKKLARIAGFLYLLVIITGMFAELFVREHLTVPGDAAATAHNILASEQLFRFGFTADIFNMIVGLPVIIIVYILFKPVNSRITRLAMLFVIIANAVMGSNLLNQMATLLLLTDTHYLSALNTGQLQGLSLFFHHLQANGYSISLTFFGCYCILVGWLIFKSAFMPRIPGILYSIAGLGYLVNSFSLFLYPSFEDLLFPYILIPPFIGESSVCLWLLIKGVRPAQPPSPSPPVLA